MTVTYRTISDDQSGQRLDNYLFSAVKGVPKSRIYRAIRGGEVRINKKRCKPTSRLQVGDEVRIPPLRQSEALQLDAPSDRLKVLLEKRIVIETKDIILINKPSGIAVHGGSEVSLGLVEALRQMRPLAKRLELVHRLDKETSGCLLLAKKRTVLSGLQDRFRHGQMQKRYWVLVKGDWDRGRHRCELSLVKFRLEGGERVVKVDRDGQSALTIFKPIQKFGHMTLLEAHLKTGRTHQIRVHLQALGFPIAGDTKYGDREFNKKMRTVGLKRMFLQCMELSYRDGNDMFGTCVMLDDDLQQVL